MGEAHMIKCNLQWEQTRYLASMLYNVNCNKKAQMITPDKLFPLPQDIFLERGTPKSTKEEMQNFLKEINTRKIKK
jgi:hypothetical protein